MTLELTREQISRLRMACLCCAHNVTDERSREMWYAIREEIIRQQNEQTEEQNKEQG